MQGGPAPPAEPGEHHTTSKHRDDEEDHLGGGDFRGPRQGEQAGENRNRQEEENREKVEQEPGDLPSDRGLFAARGFLGWAGGQIRIALGPGEWFALCHGSKVR